MITKFAVERFKCFRRLELSDLTRVVVVGGRNDVGKTALLEAIFASYHVGTPLILILEFNWRGHFIQSQDLRDIWLPVFNEYDASEPVAFEATNDGTDERLTIALLSGRDAQSAVLSANIQALPSVADQNRSVSGALRLIRTTTDGREPTTWDVVLTPNGQMTIVGGPSPESRKGAILPIRHYESEQDIATKFSQLDSQKGADSLLDVLRMVDDRIRSVSVLSIGNVPLVAADIGLRRKVPITHMGDGMSRLLTIVLDIAANAGGVFLLDEYESGFHHSVQEKVFRAILEASRRYNCQLFTTTHSYEALLNLRDAARGGYEEDLSYIRLSRSGEGIKATTYDFEHLDVALDTNMELR